jgi:hypothetical protein
VDTTQGCYLLFMIQHVIECSNNGHRRCALNKQR